MMESIVHVVDDDEAVRESLEALLMVAGYDVRTYRSAEDFLSRRVSASGPEAGCLLLDVNMPGLSGLDLLGRLRDEGREGPVLVLTARREEGLRDAALRLGARDLMLKPVAGERLLEAVASAVAAAPAPHTVNPL